MFSASVEVMCPLSNELDGEDVNSVVVVKHVVHLLCMQDTRDCILTKT